MQQQTVTKTPAAPVAAQRDAQGPQRAPDGAQRAAQQSYLKTLRPGPVEQAAPGAAAPPPAAAAGAPGAAAPGALVPQEKEGFWARACKKLKGAAQWAGDKATQAKNATVAAYDYTVDTAGKAWDKTKQVAGDAYDVAKNTSLGYANGKVSGKTNVAEVADLMPQQYRDAMTFDKSAKNEVAVEYDVKTGVVTARASTLALSKLAMGPLTAGPTTLKDVVITLNRDNKGAAAKGAPAAEGKKLDNMHATIHVGGVSATDVSYMGPRGLLKANQVELAGLDAKAFNPGGGMPMTDEAKDHMVGTFNVEKATVRGLSGEAASATEISSSKISGGLDQDAGTAYAQMGGTDVKQGRFGNRSVEQAAIRDARIGVQGKPGAMPYLEDSRQPLKVDAQVGHAEVQGVKAPEGSARAASIDGFSAEYDMASPNAKASLAAARLQGAQLGGTKVKDAQLTNLQAQREGTTLSGSVEQASMSGLKSKAVSADAASVHAARGSYDLESGDASLGVKSMRADGLKSGKNGAKSAALSGLAAERKGEAITADLASADLRGVKAGKAGGDVKATGLHADATLGEKPTLAGRATTLEGRNLHAGTAAATTARVDGAHVGLDAKGTWSGGANSANATGIKAGDATVSSASVKGVSGRRDAAGNLSAGVDSAQAKGISAAGEKVETASLQGLMGRQDAAGRTTASVTSAQASGITGDKFRAKSVGVDGLAGTLDGSQGSLAADRLHGEALGAGTVSADKADFRKVALAGDQKGHGTVSTAQGQVDNLAVGDAFKAKSVSAGQLAVGRDAKGFTAKADTLNGAAIKAGTNEVAQLDAKGVDTGFGGANGKARIDAQSIGVEQARFGEFGLQSGQAQGAGVAVAANGNVSTRADALHADQVTSRNFSARRVDAHGVATQQSEKGMDVRAGDASARNAAFKSGGFQASADEAHVERGHVAVGRDGDLQAEVGKLGGRGVAFESAPETRTAESAATTPATTARGNRTAGPAPTTTSTTPAPTTEAAQAGPSKGALVRGLSQRVEEVDAKFSAPMRETSDGPVTVDKGTRMNAEVHARDNKLVPGQTGVKFSQDLDAPAWIGVRGASLEADKKSARGGKPATQGRVEADLSGFWDQDVTDKVNDGLGRKGKDTIPLSLSELGDLAGTKMDEATPAQTTQSPSSASGGGRTNARRGTQTPAPAPVQQTTPAKPGPIDLDQAELDARVKLSAGRVPLGGRQHVDIGQAGKDGNTLNVRARGGEGMVVDMAQVVLGSLNVQSGKKKVQAAGAQVNDAQVKVGTGQNAGKFKGTIGSFETDGVGVQ